MTAVRPGAGVPGQALSPQSLPVPLGNESPNDWPGQLNPSPGTGGGRGRGEGHRCCGCMEPHRPVSPLIGEDGWAAGDAGDLLPSPASGRGVPCSPMPASPTRVHTPSLCTHRRASSIIVHALSLCMLRRLARSVFVHAPPSCTLHLQVCSIFARASPSCTLRHCAHSCLHVCCIMHAPASCTLHLCALSIFTCAPSCVLRRRACSIVVHTPSSRLPVDTQGNPELGSRWQGGLCVGTHAHCRSTGSVPPAAASPAPAHPRPARVNAGGEDACEPSCQFRNECCL